MDSSLEGARLYFPENGNADSHDLSRIEPLKILSALEGSARKRPIQPIFEPLIMEIIAQKPLAPDSFLLIVYMDAKFSF